VFAQIKRSDDRFLILNGLLLLCVSVIPFSTSLVAAYIQHAEARTAVLVYTGINFLMAVCFNNLWNYASRNGRLLAHDHDTQVAEGISKSYRFGPIIYFIVFCVAFVSVAVSVAACMLLAVYFAIPPRKHATSS
jgi:uncharacterized membrane protein